MSNEASSDPPASLKQILERSKLLTAKIEQRELPRIERGLDQIDSQTHTLTSKLPQGEQGNVDIRAHYFLSKGRVNTQVLMRDLGTIHLGAAPEHRQPIQDTDIEGYFMQEQTCTIIDVIEDGKQEVLSDMENAYDQDLHATWRSLRAALCSGYDNEQAQADMTLLNPSRSKIDPNRIVSAGVWEAR